MTKPKENQQWSIEIPNTSNPNLHGNIRRAADVDSATPKLAFFGCRTLYEAIRRGKQINPLGPCLGFRAVSSSGYSTPFIFSSYTEVVSRVDAFACGLERVKLVERNEDGLILLGLYMRNCMEWVIAEHGIFSIGGATVPLYDTLGPHTIDFILNQTNTPTVVTIRSNLSHLCEVKKSGQCPNFHTVILVDGVIPESSKMAKDVGLNVISFAKLEAIGAQVIAAEGHNHSPPSSTDLATLCYTSGTTGNPKGAMITHQNLVSAMCALVHIINVLPSDRYLSYLPLPHIMERISLTQMLGCGAAIGFYRGDPLLLMEDVQALRPTLFIAAPRVLNKIHDKIKAGIAATTPLKRRLFDMALKTKTDNLFQYGKLTHAFYDKILFNKIKTGLGLDKCRYLISGSAPLSDTVMVFFRCMLGIPVLEGYGQTEGTALATLGHPDDLKTCGHVGGPHVVEIVLMDVPEMGYFSVDTHHGDEPCRGRGEICIRGPNVFQGYYKNEEGSKEMLDEKGWLHSGDIGLWMPDGQLKIIDRKKNIFKLAQGEYIAPEKIENILHQSSLISQCFVYGDSFQSTLVAIIIPDEEVLRAWAKDNDLSSHDAPFEQLCTEPRLKQEVMSQIQSISKSNGLMGFETVKNIYIDWELFSVEKGLLTPTFKLKRQQLREFYQKEIEALYDEIAAVVSPPSSKL